MPRKILTAALAAMLLMALALPGLAGEHGMGHHAFTPTESLTPAAAPLYPVGSEVLLNADHMEGMRSAVAKVSGAFDTVLYAVDYVHTETGEPVKAHKWVIREEIEGHGGEPFAAGDTVRLLPGHISSMGGEGAEATIAQVLPGVAYMVDFTPTGGGEPVTYHQWVSEDELLPFGTLPGSPGCD